MALIELGPHPDLDGAIMYRAECDGCSTVMPFTIWTNPLTAMDDADWRRDGDRWLCWECNPTAPGNRTEIPAAFKEG